MKSLVDKILLEADVREELDVFDLLKEIEADLENENLEENTSTTT